MTTILDITDMASRNVKVAWDLFPSAFSGYLMQEGKRPQIDIKSNHGIHYNWKYDNYGNPEFQKLYLKAKKGQWDADDLAWNTSVDPSNFELEIFPEKLQPMYGTDMYRKVDRKKQGEMLHSTIAWLLSQFLHGEQGALYATKNARQRWQG